MQMKETSRAGDKKLRDNNNLEYQIERLHIYGDEHPESGLHNKVKGFQFKNKISVPDPVKKITTEEPMKPFMVNQLTIAFERGRMILSPYDETLHKQLIDYEVERISQSGLPVYTSKNEHFVDALGLAYLAFVLEFPNITQGIKEITYSSKIIHSKSGFRETQAQKDLNSLSLSNIKNPWSNIKVDHEDLPGDRPTYFKVPLGTQKPGSSSSFIWGNRSSSGSQRSSFRSVW